MLYRWVFLTVFGKASSWSQSALPEPELFAQHYVNYQRLPLARPPSFYWCIIGRIRAIYFRIRISFYRFFERVHMGGQVHAKTFLKPDQLIFLPSIRRSAYFWLTQRFFGLREECVTFLRIIVIRYRVQMPAYHQARSLPLDWFRR